MAALDLDAEGYSLFHSVVYSARCKVSFGAYAIFPFPAVSGRHRGRLGNLMGRKQKR
jgi:hypothetical protein